MIHSRFRRWAWVILSTTLFFNCTSEEDNGGENSCDGADCVLAGRGGQGGKGGESGGTHVDPTQPGGVQWSKDFPGVSDRYLSWVTRGPGEDLVVTGFFTGTIDLGGGSLSSGEKWANSEPEYSVFVARLAGDGSHIWSKRLGGAGSARAQGTAVDAKGNVLLVGSFTGSLTVGETSLVSAGKSDVFLVSLDSKGIPKWAKQFGDAEEQAGNAVGVDSEGNVFITGVLTGSTDFGKGALTSAGAQDIFLAKFTSDGEPIWSRRFGDASAQRAISIAVDGMDGLILTGSFYGKLNLGGKTLTSAGGSDAFVARFNAEGEHAWSRCLGDSADQVGRAIAIDAKHRVVWAGDFAGQIDPGSNNGSTTILSGCTGVGKYGYIANGHCYSYKSEEKTYEEARSTCTALGDGWTLTALSSQDELTFLQKTFDLSKAVWLGGNDIAADGTWAWETGEPFSFAPWGEGEPNGGTNENCAELKGGKLNDLPCGEKRAFLCEQMESTKEGSGGASGAGGADGAAGVGGGDSAGGAAGAGGAVESPTVVKSKGGLDAFLVQLDATGQTLWSHSIGAEDDQRLWTVTYDAQGNIVIGGDMAGPISLGSTPLAEGRILFASLDPSGKVRWADRFGPDIGQGLAVTSTSKSIFAAGVFSGAVDFGDRSHDAADRIGAFLLSLTP